MCLADDIGKKACVDRLMIASNQEGDSVHLSICSSLAFICLHTVLKPDHLGIYSHDSCM